MQECVSVCDFVIVNYVRSQMIQPANHCEWKTIYLKWHEISTP